MKISTSNRKAVFTALSVAVLLIIWQLISLAAGSEHILPGPAPTLKATFELLADRSFLYVVGGTLLRGLAGFAIAVAAGILLGIAGGLRSDLAAFLKPWVIVLRSTPVVAFILLAIIWLDAATVPVFIGILTMFPMIYLNIAEGIRSIDRKTVEMARFYGLHGRRLVKEVILPAIEPFAASGISTALGIGWRAIVVGEVLSQPEYGIGTAMHSAQTFLQVDILIAWTLVTIFIGALLDKAVRSAERKLIGKKA